MKIKKYSLRKRREAIAGYLFIAPLVIGLIVFYVVAFFQNIYYSFCKVGAFTSPKFIGFDNYISAFTDPKFFTALKKHFVLYIFWSDICSYIIFSNC
jgi:multiple sugar transport system permease protein